MANLHTTFETCPFILSCDIMLTWRLQFDTCWTQMTLTSTQTIGSSTECSTRTYQIWDMPNISYVRYRVYKGFAVWALLTPNDLWPHQKTIWFLYSMCSPTHFLRYQMTLTSTKNFRFFYWMRYTYIPDMRSAQYFLCDISCLQGVCSLSRVEWDIPISTLLELCERSLNLILHLVPSPHRFLILGGQATTPSAPG